MALIKNEETETISTPALESTSEEQLMLELEDTTDEYQRIQIMEKLLARRRHALDVATSSQIRLYISYQETLQQLYALITPKN